MAMEAGIIENKQITEWIRSGQRQILFALLFNIIAICRTPIIAGLFTVFGKNADWVLMLVMILCGISGVAAIALGIIGMLRLSRGFGYHWLWRILFCILLLLPLISLILLVVLNSKATAHLRAEGYRVGIFGAPPGKNLN